jgi:predicted kinase
MLMARGESVIIDATWPNAERRARARQVADRSGATITELECVLEKETARGRIATRNLTGTDGASEATPATFDRSITARDPWPEAHRISNEGPTEQALSQALRYVVRPPS